MRASIKLALFVLLSSALAIGCATESKLEPAPGAVTIGRGHNQVVDEFAGVELIANPDAWKGMPEIVQEVVPIKVIVRNRHGRPIRVGTQNFALVTDQGSRIAAKPPEEIKGVIRLTAAVPYTGPSFYSHDFYMYGPFGYYGGINRGIEPFYYDPLYYYRYQGWKDVQLPTAEMKSEALPELTVPDGGEVSGFIYFEFENLGGAKRATLKMDLVEADGNVFGTILLPFVVEGH
jgi:hypothetical protein